MGNLDKPRACIEWMAQARAELGLGYRLTVTGQRSAHQGGPVGSPILDTTGAVHRSLADPGDGGVFGLNGVGNADLRFCQLQ